MISRVDPVLGANLNDDNDDEVSFSAVDTGPQNPYLHYANEAGETTKNEDKAQRPKTGKKSSKSSSQQSNTGSSSAGNGSSSSSRPKSASRKR